MANRVLDVAGDIALVVATLGFIAFIGFYRKFADWRATAMGRHVMAFMAVLGTILLYVVLVNFFPWLLINRYVARLLIYGSVAVVVWWRVGILLRAQGLVGRKRRQDDADFRP